MKELLGKGRRRVLLRHYLMVCVLLVFPAPSLWAQVFKGATVPVGTQKYVLSSFLGRGGFGEVYLGHPESSDSPERAIKILHGNRGVDSYEAINLAILYDGSLGASRFLKTSQPQLLPITMPKDAALPSLNKWVAVAELGLSASLAKLPNLVLGLNIADNKETTQLIAAIHKVTQDLIEGVEHLRKKGLVHGDIKPANILIVGDRSEPVTSASILRGTHRVVIADLEDLGAFYNPDDPEAKPKLGRTLGFSAPERERGNINPVTDHYSMAQVVAFLFGIPDDQKDPTARKAMIDARAGMLLVAANRLKGEASSQLRELIQYMQAGAELDPRQRDRGLRRLAGTISLLPKVSLTTRAAHLIGNLYRKVCEMTAWRSGK